MPRIEEVLAGHWLEAHDWEVPSWADVDIFELSEIAPDTFSDLTWEIKVSAIALVQPCDVSPETHDWVIHRDSGREAAIGKTTPIPEGWHLVKPEHPPASPGQMALCLGGVE